MPHPTRFAAHCPAECTLGRHDVGPGLYGGSCTTCDGDGWIRLASWGDVEAAAHRLLASLGYGSTDDWSGLVAHLTRYGSRDLAMAVVVWLATCDLRAAARSDAQAVAA